LNAGSGTVALARMLTNGVQLFDYLTYTNLPSNYSYGDIPDAQPFFRGAMFSATPGATNNSLLPPISVSINEWMAENTGYMVDPTTGKFEDWFELYNPAGTPAPLGGYFLTDTLTNWNQYQIPIGFSIPAHGFLLVWADGAQSANTNVAGPLHVPFKLSKSGEGIGLFTPTGAAIDALTFGIQTENVTEGRYPDGGGLRLFMPVPSPAAPNILPPASSPPAFSSFSITPGGTVSLTVQTSPGHTYRVEYKDSLNAGSWTLLGAEQFANDSQMTFSDPAPSAIQRFYRVVQVN
jgi:hypothetical protein